MRECEASVIVPCCNRARLLPAAMACLRRQTAARGSYEVIVVDDGSTDETLAVAKACLWPQASCLRKPNGGLSSARNFGARQARGRVLIFSDPDMLVCPEFVESHLRAGGAADTAVIGAKREVIAHLPRWLPAWPTIRVLARLGRRHPYALRRAIARIQRSASLRAVLAVERLAGGFALLERYTVPAHLPEPPARLDALAVPWVFLIGCNFSMQAGSFRRIGGFDEGFRGWGLEDVELAYRFHAQGGSFAYEPRALGYHQAHAVDERRNRESLRANLCYFAAKHRSLAVRLHEDYIAGSLSLEDYDRAVREAREGGAGYGEA